MVLERLRAKFRKPEEQPEEVSWSNIVATIETLRIPPFNISYECIQGDGGSIPITKENINTYEDAIETHLSHGDLMSVVFLSHTVLAVDKHLISPAPEISQVFKLVP